MNKTYTGDETTNPSVTESSNLLPANQSTINNSFSGNAAGGNLEGNTATFHSLGGDLATAKSIDPV